MQQLKMDGMTGASAEAGWSHILQVDLPDVPGRERLADHIDQYIALFLREFDAFRSAFTRLDSGRFGLDAGSADWDALARLRDELATRLFPESEHWRIFITENEVEDESAYELARPSPDFDLDFADGEAGAVDADGAGPTSNEEGLDIAGELSRFREDLGQIAQSLTGHEALRESVDRFREEMSEMSEIFAERVTNAAGTIDHAAQRIEASAALMPDPDRLELVLTRNEASAAILERGVRQSLTLLLQAVETMAERGALDDEPQRRIASGD
ncbi:hypothetical protein [Marinicauda pacifica]|jgi:hypothetical protein|uniref:hypothetical protein n=1 Tax=Marinicauda pacifica TaxID=1133559 RepID=UPI0035C7B670